MPGYFGEEIDPCRMQATCAICGNLLDENFFLYDDGPVCSTCEQVEAVRLAGEDDEPDSPSPL